jgi:hypothetical protein
MRALLAFVILVGGMLTLSPPNAGADTDSARKRSAKSDHDAQSRHLARQQVECERARHEDPSGVYAAYPCWAREVFGRGTQGGGQGGRR